MLTQLKTIARCFEIMNRTYIFKGKIIEGDGWVLELKKGCKVNNIKDQFKLVRE